MTPFYRLMVATAAIFGVTSAARADGPASGEVTGVSVQAAPGRADVIINVRGAVEVRDFMLENPNRLVLDVVGAKLKGNPVSDYDGVKRGGVLNLRFAQFKPDVVRIVLDLDRAMDYHVERVADAIRVSFGTDQSFLAWSSNDRRSPKAPAAKPAPRGEPEVQLPATRLVRSMAETEPRITVVWDRANIADVVAGFAAFSGRTIILGKDIKGEVSAEIRNQPWPQAFQAVLAAQGLSAQEMAGGIIRVDNPSALAALDSLEPLETSVVRINYGKAKDMTKSVEGSLTKGRGKIIADDNSNSLIITDTRSRIGNLTDIPADRRRLSIWLKPEDLAKERCPKCGSPIELRTGRFGPYLACVKYKDTCDYVKSLKKDKVPDRPSDEKCHLCGSAMVIKTGRFGEFLACTTYPKCKGTRSIPMGLKCPKCPTGDLTERRTKRGKSFWGCLRYPECDFSTWNRPVPETCPVCGWLGMEKRINKAEGETRKCLKCGHRIVIAEPEEVALG